MSPGSRPGRSAKDRPRGVGAGMAEGPEAQLVEKLRRIEALFARAGSEGERVAAERARERIRALIGAPGI